MRIQTTFVAFAVSTGALLHAALVTQAHTVPQALPSQALTPAAAASQAVSSQAADSPTLTLGGLGLGTSTSDLTAAHGHPTALALIAGTGGRVSRQQTPPKPPSLFNLKPHPKPNSLPDWTASVIPPLDAGHVMWLYRHKSYTLAFKVNREGIVDEALVASLATAPSPATQLRSGNGIANLGDNSRKVLSLFGSPDSTRSYENKAGQIQDFVFYYKSLAVTFRNDRVVRFHLGAIAN